MQKDLTFPAVSPAQTEGTAPVVSWGCRTEPELLPRAGGLELPAAAHVVSGAVGFCSAAGGTRRVHCSRSVTIHSPGPASPAVSEQAMVEHLQLCRALGRAAGRLLGTGVYLKDYFRLAGGKIGENNAGNL